MPRELNRRTRLAMNALACELTEKLRASPYLPLRDLKCVPCQGDLVIRGQVPTLYLKRLLWQIALTISPGSQVRDEVDVVPPRAWANSSSFA